MNDSFLADLDLIPKEPNAKSNSHIDNRYITTRKALSPPTNIPSKNAHGNPDPKQEKIISSSSSNVPKIKSTRRSGSQETRKLSVPEPKPLSSTPKSDRKSQGDENPMKSVENQIKRDDLKAKPHDVKTTTKMHDAGKPPKDNRRSRNSGSSSRYIDASSKENTRPSTDSGSSGSQSELKKEVPRRISDNSKKTDIFEKTDPVMLLNAIKELISTYTEQETVKVLRAMQNLHMNSQSNLIKQMMQQTSELTKELNSNKDFGNVKSLIEENERMREDIFILRARNEVLQKRVDEMTLLREENISLKLKLKELQQ